MENPCAGQQLTSSRSCSSTLLIFAVFTFKQARKQFLIKHKVDLIRLVCPLSFGYVVSILGDGWGKCELPDVQH